MDDEDAEWLRSKAEFAPDEDTEARYKAIAERLSGQEQSLCARWDRIQELESNLNDMAKRAGSAEAQRDLNALKLEGVQMMLDSWKSAYERITAGDHAEVRLDPDGAIDEVVGSGVFHMEQMDTNRWFFDLAGCRFNIDGKKVTLTPIEVNTWTEEQKRVAESK